MELPVLEPALQGPIGARGRHVRKRRQIECLVEALPSEVGWASPRIVGEAAPFCGSVRDPVTEPRLETSALDDRGDARVVGQAATLVELLAPRQEHAVR